MGRVTAIVLAAGESRRMGKLKPLLPYGSATVIQAVVRSLKASPVGPVLVVLGHRADEIAELLGGEDVEVVRNPRYPEGMLTSVQAGAAAAPPDAEWLLIALGDQPSLEPEMVDHILRAAHDDASATLVVPSYAGRRGHPLLIHARHRQEIMELEPEGGLRTLLQRHADTLIHVEVPTETVLCDMDTPEDYEREVRRLSNTS